MLWISDGWEMQKLILQQAGLSLFLIVAMFYFKNNQADK